MSPSRVELLVPIVQKMSIAGILVKSTFLVAWCSAAIYAQRHEPPPVRSFANTATDAAATQSETATSPGQSVQRYATKNRKFSIPFSLVSHDQIIVEVLLHLSTDLGRTWEQHSRADLRQNEFEFVASQDGEYWFAVQTLNRNGQRLPPKVTQPELVVVVDTVNPTLDAQATSDASGRLIVSWEVRDDYIATDSLAVRIRPSRAPNAAWMNVPAKITKPLSGPRFQDSYAFWPESSDLEFDVEVSIRDQAGNQATAQTSVQRSQATPQFSQIPASRPRVPTPLGDATGMRSFDSNSLTIPKNTSTTETAQTSPQVWNNSKPDTPTAGSQTLAANSAPQAVEWRSARHSDSGKFLASSSTQRPMETRPVLRPLAQPGNPSDQIAQNDSQQPPQLAADPMSKPPAMLVADRTDRETPQPLNSVLQSTPDQSNLAQQAIPINTKRFRLNYQLESIDPAGVKEVAVWVTRDGGQSWTRLGAALDPQGPYPVEVDGSGLFGFRLVVISYNGQKSRLPQPGDQAEKWVRVDVDPPVARITSAPFGTGADTGKLIIHWEAHDDQLALRPITLDYSSTPDGPWTTIEKGLRNTGSYPWLVPADVPSKVFLRLVVRDEAGNEKVDQTLYPIEIGGLYPRGLIRSVEPIKE